MIHLSKHMDPHPHATVAEARACQSQMDYDAAEALSEIWAENAWLRAAEYNPRQREEDEREIAREAALFGPLYSAA